MIWSFSQRQAVRPELSGSFAAAQRLRAHQPLVAVWAPAGNEPPGHMSSPPLGHLNSASPIPNLAAEFRIVSEGQAAALYISTPFHDVMRGAMRQQATKLFDGLNKKTWINLWAFDHGGSSVVCVLSRCSPRAAPTSSLTMCLEPPIGLHPLRFRGEHAPQPAVRPSRPGGGRAERQPHRE